MLIYIQRFIDSLLGVFWSEGRVVFFVSCFILRHSWYSRKTLFSSVISLAYRPLKKVVKKTRSFPWWTPKGTSLPGVSKFPLCTLNLSWETYICLHGTYKLWFWSLDRLWSTLKSYRFFNTIIKTILALTSKKIAIAFCDWSMEVFASRCPHTVSPLKVILVSFTSKKMK